MKIVYNVVCIGAGGTGTFFLKEFARFMASFRLKDVGDCKRIYLSIVDGDHVEENNLERQAFIKDDINLNKAVCMAKAIKENFGLKRVKAYPKYIDEVDDLNLIFHNFCCSDEDCGSHFNIPIVNILIGCVDNHRVRQVMDRYFNRVYDTIFYFDSANEYGNGEVVFAGRSKGKLLGRPRAAYFPAILEDTSPRASEISCGEQNISSPQHICTNMMAADLLLSRTTALIAENKIEFGIAIFDVFRMHLAYYPDQDCIKEEDKADERRTEGQRRGKDANQGVQKAS
ncbi:ThiF family adenylyltransferase (plasmid) [Enterocloster clostridioformis]